MPQEPSRGRAAGWLRWRHAASPIGCWPVRQQEGGHFWGLGRLGGQPPLAAMFRRVSRVSDPRGRRAATPNCVYAAVHGRWRWLRMRPAEISSSSAPHPRRRRAHPQPGGPCSRKRAPNPGDPPFALGRASDLASRMRIHRARNLAPAQVRCVWWVQRGCLVESLRVPQPGAPLAARRPPLLAILLDALDLDWMESVGLVCERGPPQQQ